MLGMYIQVTGGASICRGVLCYVSYFDKLWQAPRQAKIKHFSTKQSAHETDGGGTSLVSHQLHR